MTRRRLRLATSFAMFFLCLSGQPAFADAPASQQMTIEEMRSRLNLTPEQQAKIQPYAEARKAKLQEVQSKMSSATSKHDKRTAMKEAKAAQDEFVKNVNPILTADQQAEWKKMRDEAREKMKEQWRSRPGS